MTQPDVRQQIAQARPIDESFLRGVIGSTTAYSEGWRDVCARLLWAEAELARLSAEHRQMREALEWALGERGEFGEEPLPVAGKYRQRYWWRTELRQRAFAPPRAPEGREG